MSEQMKWTGFTRNGKKVNELFRFNAPEFAYPWHGVVNGVVHSWNDKGEFINGDIRGWDLMPVEEPKPEPAKPVPFDRATIPRDAWFREIGNDDEYPIGPITSGGVHFDSMHYPTWYRLQQSWEYSHTPADETSWRRCEVQP